MYKITGGLNGLYPGPEEGQWVEVKDTVYARNKFTLAIKTFLMQLGYDWVEVTTIEEI